MLCFNIHGISNTNTLITAGAGNIDEGLGVKPRKDKTPGIHWWKCRIMKDIQQSVVTKLATIERYETICVQFRQNMIYNMNQKRFFPDFGEQVFGGNDAVLDAEESIKVKSGTTR